MERKKMYSEEFKRDAGIAHYILPRLLPVGGTLSESLVGGMPDYASLTEQTNQTLKARIVSNL